MTNFRIYIHYIYKALAFIEFYYHFRNPQREKNRG